MDMKQKSKHLQQRIQRGQPIATTAGDVRQSAHVQKRHTKPPMRTAYHEAGHILMAWLSGGIIERATIGPSLSKRGYKPDVKRGCAVRGITKWKPGWTMCCILPKNPIDEILILVAGAVAEQVYFRATKLETYTDGGQDDYTVALDLKQANPPR
jgi:hypothetical protein